jgi:hypothetical protein
MSSVKRLVRFLVRDSPTSVHLCRAWLGEINKAAMAAELRAERWLPVQDVSESRLLIEAVDRGRLGCQLLSSSELVQPYCRRTAARLYRIAAVYLAASEALVIRLRAADRERDERLRSAGSR